RNSGREPVLGKFETEGLRQCYLNTFRRHSATENMKSFRMMAATMGRSRNALVFTRTQTLSKAAENSCEKSLKNGSCFGFTGTFLYRPSMGLSSPSRKWPDASF